MIAIGNVKLGVRIEPIYVQELSREEVKDILGRYGLYTEQIETYPIDRRLIGAFRSDEQRLHEYVDICKYAFERRNHKSVKKPNAKDLSIFSDELEITYELKDMKKTEALDNEVKVNIYKQAKETQSLFRSLGASNVKMEIGVIDRAFFEVQSLLHSLGTKKRVQALPEGDQAKPTKTYRQDLFDKEAQKATEQVSEKWTEQPKKEKEEYTKN